MPDAWGFLCRTCELGKLECCCGFLKEMAAVINRVNLTLFQLCTPEKIRERISVKKMKIMMYPSKGHVKMRGGI